MNINIFDSNNYVFSLWSIPPLLMSLLYIILGIFVFSKNIRSRVNQTFLLLCLTSFWWQFSWFILFNTRNDAIASILVKVGYTGINFIGTTFLHFIVEQFEFKKMKPVVYICYGLSFIMLGILWTTNLYINGFYKFFWGYYPKAAILHIAHLIIQCGICLLTGLILVIISLFKYKDNVVKRNQAKYLIAAFSIYGLAASDYIVNWGIEFYPFGYIPCIICASIIAFTIVRYRLMEIDTVIHKTLLWGITSVLIFMPMALIFVFIRPWLTQLSWIGLTIFAVILFYLFLSYYNTIQPRIDHIFRRRKYDYQKVLGEIGQKIGSELNLEKLIKRLFVELTNILYIKNGLLLVQDLESADYLTKGSTGYSNNIEFPKEKKINLPFISAISHWINQYQRAIEKDNIEQDPQYNQIKKDLMEFFNQNYIEVLIPLITENRVNALLCLGKKENLRLYTITEIELLERIGLQIGVTIENALHHEDILKKQRFQEEMRIAERIQTALVPSIPSLEDLEISAIMKPAEEVGGDYYDIVEDRQKKLWFAIGDVTGHGVTPGLIMMMAQSSFSTIIRAKEDITPKFALIEVNHLLYNNIVDRLDEFHNMTMQFLKYLGKGAFVFSNAGHPGMIIYRSQTKTCESLNIEGILLGVKPDITNEINELNFLMEKDDILLLYTDGISESHTKDGNELWGERRLQEVLRQNANKGLEVVRDNILKSALDWSNHHIVDDMTMVLVKKR